MIEIQKINTKYWFAGLAFLALLLMSHPIFLVPVLFSSVISVNSVVGVFQTSNFRLQKAFGGERYLLNEKEYYDFVKRYTQL